MHESEIDRAGAARLEHLWAAHAVHVAEQLARLEPALGTTTHELADGVLVLQGPGMYVNRALALGLTASVAEEDLDRIEAMSTALGVRASVELSAFSDQGLTASCARRGMTPGTDTSVLISPIDDLTPWNDPSIDVRPIGPDELAIWQQVSADAWEVDTDAARRASGWYAAAANATADETLVLARDTTDGRLLGCATVIINDGIASLAGMSTLPAERRRGVQAALVHARTAIGRAAGCTVAAVSAVSGGASERNLVRLGFRPAYTKASFTRPDRA